LGIPIPDEVSMNDRRSIVVSIVLVAIFFLFSGCASIGFLPADSPSAGNPPGEDSVQMTIDVRTKRPPSKLLPQIISDNDMDEYKHIDLYQKGFAKIGIIRCLKDYRYSATEDSVKYAFLKEAQKQGADAVLMYAMPNEEEREIQNVTVLGIKWDSSRSSSWADSAAAHEKKIFKYISGAALLFSYDPALASQQLVAGRNRWEKETPGIREKQSVVLAKLAKVENILHAYGEFVFTKGNAQRDELLKHITYAKEMIVKGFVFSLENYLYENVQRKTSSGCIDSKQPRELDYIKDCQRQYELSDSLQNVMAYIRDNQNDLSRADLLNIPDKLILD
jgi:hypothetical protein